MCSLTKDDFNIFVRVYVIKSKGILLLIMLLSMRVSFRLLDRRKIISSGSNPESFNATAHNRNVQQNFTFENRILLQYYY